jgi:hypothetical protein
MLGEKLIFVRVILFCAIGILDTPVDKTISGWP